MSDDPPKKRVAYYAYESTWPICNLLVLLPTLLANEMFYLIQFCTALDIADHNILINNYMSSDLRHMSGFYIRIRGIYHLAHGYLLFLVALHS